MYQLIFEKEHPYQDYFETSSSQSPQMFNVEFKVANDPSFRPKIDLNLLENTKKALLEIEDHSLSLNGGDEPMQKSNNSKNVQRVFEEMNSKVEGTAISVIELMRNCWDHDPTKRPSFLEISKILKKIAKKNRIQIESDILPK